LSLDHLVQLTVETSTFGSEFVTLRIAVELVESLRYKLRVFGISITAPTNVYCDNEVATKNTIFPESTLKTSTTPLHITGREQRLLQRELSELPKKTEKQILRTFDKVVISSDERLFM
jgi:hypothetical protein